MEEKNRKLLKFAGIINILEGTLFCINNSVTTLGLIIIAIGVLIISIGNKSIEEQCENKILLFILALVHLLVNFINAVILFIVWDTIVNYQKNINGINAPPEESKKEVVNPEVRKIDSLLKLGVAMVFISGVIFATSSWDFISNVVKIIILLLFGLLFLLLSYFTENKLKLEKSSFVYWILSMSFLLLSVIGIEFFGIFGQFLTFTGEGKYLAYFIVMAIFGFLSNITYFKYRKTYLIYITYVSYLIATHNIVMQAKPSLIFSLIVISVINIITFLIDKKNGVLNEISGMFIYILSLLVCANIYTEEMTILKILAALLSIINIIFIKEAAKDDMLSILGIVITFILVSTTLASLNIEIASKLLLMFIILTTYSVLNNLKSNSSLITEINNIIYTFFTVVAYIILIETDALTSLLVAAIYLLFALTAKSDLKYINQSKVFNMFLPLVVPMIIFPFVDLIGINGDLNYAYGLAVSSACYCIGHYTFKDNGEKKRFLVYGIIATILSLLASLNVKEMMVSLFPVVTSIYITGIYYNNKIKTDVIWPYILFLVSLYCMLIYVWDIHIVFSTIIYIWLILMVMIFFNSDLIKKITEISIVIPIFNLINQQNLGYVLESIAISVLILYITFLINKFIAKNHKCVLAIIGIVISLIEIIFQANLYIGIYVGLVGIIVMVIGYNFEEYSKLFKLGIGIIILNIIVQLFELWEKVPFPIYLLVTGLGIIGFVTFKEMKKIDTKKEDK